MATSRQSGRKQTPSRAKPPVAGGVKAVRPNGARRDQEVLEAAIKVFSSRGYADASVQDIADELGILKGSLYHYIDSKEDLLFRLMDETHVEVETILEEVLALDADDPIHLLQEYFSRQAAYMTQNVARMSIYYHDLDQLSEGRRRDLIRKRRVHEKFVVGLIERAQADGQVDSGLDPQLTVNYLFGSMIWIYRWYKPNGKIKSVNASQGLADIVTRALTGRPA